MFVNEEKYTYMKKEVKRIIKAQDVMMGDISIRQPLPTSSMEMVDPFLLLHHFGPVTQHPGEKSILPVGPHPHRGFEPITFVFKGSVHHRDSRGNDSIINTGGVQWMTAGMGIIHSEMPSKEFINEGGELEIIQLWANLPSDKKFVQPNYQGFQKDAIPVVSTKGTHVKVISGQYNDISGPIKSLTGITALIIEMEKGSNLKLSVNNNENSLIYQLDGLVKCNGIECGKHKLATFSDEGQEIQLEAISDSTILYVSGTPLNEKVVQYGPYVMNTQTEILEAMRDYQMGKMGVLI